MRPKLGGFTGIIDRILEEERGRPRKQRHTARRIFQRLKAEHGFTGGETIVRTYPAETAEAFCYGHSVAFAFFGGVPRSMLYDNTRLAVARILGDGTRQRTRAFSELLSHFLFADRFARLGKGSDTDEIEQSLRRDLVLISSCPRVTTWHRANDAGGLPAHQPTRGHSCNSRSSICRTAPGQAVTDGVLQCPSAGRTGVKPGASGAPLRGCGA